MVDPHSNSSEGNSESTSLDDFGEFIAEFEDLLDSIPNEILDQYRERLEMSVERGIYENATLETKETRGVSVALSSAYFWSSSIDGTCNIDIPHDEIPDDVDLTDCELQINSSSGVPLLSGPIVKVGQENGLGGNTTVVVNSRS